MRAPPLLHIETALRLPRAFRERLGRPRGGMVKVAVLSAAAPPLVHEERALFPTRMPGEVRGRGLVVCGRAGRCLGGGACAGNRLRVPRPRDDKPHVIPDNRRQTVENIRRLGTQQSHLLEHDRPRSGEEDCVDLLTPGFDAVGDCCLEWRRRHRCRRRPTEYSRPCRPCSGGEPRWVVPMAIGPVLAASRLHVSLACRPPRPLRVGQMIVHAGQP
mmetsp:Transcript_42131/g.100015  ORF Transcript_42131/g.100015 Transcript_42131/m.100015 type:complete len:216 (+) Transcript_42131:133-780(+)